MAPPLLPITRLVNCSGCDELVKRGEVVCPHCGALIDGRGGLGKMVGAAAVAGVLSSCIIAEPAYGVVVATDTGSESGTGTDSNSTGGVTEATDTGEEETASGTGTMSNTQATMNPETGESDYGVPTTDETAGTETGSESGSESGSETGSSGETGTTGTGTDSAGEADYGVPSTF